MKLSIVVPVYNEKNTIREIIKRVLASNIGNLEKEIIIVDDGSVDGTREILKNEIEGKPYIKIIYKEKNEGKTSALVKGFNEVSGDIVIIQDADLEYNPDEYIKLIEPIIEGKADVVYGSRFLGGPRRTLLFWHTVGNKFLTLLSNIFTNLNLTDIETCYKAFRTDVIKSIKISSKRFGFEPEITAKIAKMKYRIYEVPISYTGREYWEGKKIGWKDGFDAIYTIIKFAFIDDEEDNAPYKMLQQTGKLRSYNALIFEKIKPYLGDKILEVGSGIGNITKYLIKKDYILATDIDEKYLTYLRNILRMCPSVEVKCLDISSDKIEKELKEKFDTVICLNVLEHIEDDFKVLHNIKSYLCKGGNLILLVPAMPLLYGTLDIILEHKRRYSKEEIKDKLIKAGFEIYNIEYFNIFGSIGWFINSKILKRKKHSSIQLLFFNLLVPLIRLERYLKIPFGISLL